MRRLMRGILITIMALVVSAAPGICEAGAVWMIVDEAGKVLTSICEEPAAGDQYITADNMLYEVISISGQQAMVSSRERIVLPALDWMELDMAIPVSAQSRHIALYCTHSDESYEPSDGVYSTTQRGSIYEIAQSLADNLINKNIDAIVSDMLHHPHDAGAYRRSRQTAVALLKQRIPDCMIDVHRDGIPDPASYAVTIGGEDVSKIRLLVGRGNQNAEANKEFALLIKAVADRVYPGLIKDIYLGKGTFNQDLLSRSILFECGTYTLEKERVLRSMPLMADVLSRALYGGVVGSVGRVSTDANHAPQATGGVTMGQADTPVNAQEIGSGGGFLAVLLLAGIIGIAILSTGSLRRGGKKVGRNLHEMTGGLLGTKPKDGEDHEHS